MEISSASLLPAMSWILFAITRSCAAPLSPPATPEIAIAKARCDSNKVIVIVVASFAVTLAPIRGIDVTPVSLSKKK